MSFQNKVAVITGAGGTLGSVIAKDLAASGASVVLLGRTLEKLQKVANEISGTTLILPTDVTDEAALRNAAQEVEAQLGPCDLLINAAGGNNIKAMTTNFAFQPEEITAERPEDMVGFFNLDMAMYAQVLQNNTLGTVLPCRVFGRSMAKQGHGAILNFASMNSYRPLTRVPAYGMAKAAIVNFTQWLAEYLAPAGVRVNAVAPGFFVNDRSRKYLNTPDGGLTQRGQNVLHHTPMKRFGEASDLVGTVRWLLDDTASAFVTGITVPVDGGFLSSSGI